MGYIVCFAYLRSCAPLTMFKRIQSYFKKPDRAVALPASPNLSDAELKEQADGCMREEKFGLAAQLYQQLIGQNPRHAKAHCNLGFVLLEQGKALEAETALRRAIVLDATIADAHYMLGQILQGRGEAARAIDAFEQALLHDAELPFAYRDLCFAYLDQKAPDKALELLDKALSLYPDFPPLQYLAAKAHGDLKQFSTALPYCERALAMGFDVDIMHFAHGVTLQGLQRHSDALASYERAIHLKPDLVAAHFNTAVCHLLMGNFESGWRELEWRWQHDDFKFKKPPAPLWTGRESLANKTIFVALEQGFGDTIQFCRYLKMLAQRGGRVIFCAPPQLRALMSGVDGIAHLCAPEDPLPPMDYYCHLMSLPYLFETRQHNIPATIPYISSDINLRDAARRRFGSAIKPRIGLLWAGNPDHLNDRNRSMSIDTLAGVISDRYAFVSLQMPLTETERDYIAERNLLDDWGQHITSFANTAALLELLDLVICVDTAIAHLAGAMGKPVWVLLPYNRDWRWRLEGDDSAWYPTMRLFRQSAPGDWSGVIAQVKQALTDLPEAARAASTSPA
jgi:tetratricopeptide (TPR) repeat protein